MKQRVLIVNKFYYRRGGDCVCAMNLEQLLRSKGHEVAVFAMRYPENEPSQWDSYWPAQVDFAGGESEKLAALRRVLGHGDIKRCFARILKDFRPDVVHLHNIHSYLSPVLAKMAAQRRIPVVWTMHDYKLLCPSYSCLRDGEPCELCFTDKSQVLKLRCMKGSLAASAIALAEARKWNPKDLQKWTSRFICPSAFMATKMASGGFAPEKLATICNFIDPEVATRMERLAPEGSAAPRKPYYCYVGRLSAEKGVGTLLAAAAELPYDLLVAGDGPLGNELRKRYDSCKNIRFLGRLDASKIAILLSQARLSVMPSECYENNPLGVIESLCAGTPVVGANIGGIPELLDEASGVTYTSGSKEELKEAIKRLWERKCDHSALAARSLRRFTSAAHYNQLSRLYSEVTAK